MVGLYTQTHTRIKHIAKKTGQALIALRYPPSLQITITKPKKIQYYNVQKIKQIFFFSTTTKMAYGGHESYFSIVPCKIIYDK